VIFGFKVDEEEWERIFTPFLMRGDFSNRSRELMVFWLQSAFDGRERNSERVMTYLFKSFHLRLDNGSSSDARGSFPLVSQLFF
jgi:hypothetical protein